MNVSYEGLEEYTEALVFDFSQRQDDVDQRTKQSQTFKHQANLSHHMSTHFHFSTYSRYTSAPSVTLHVVRPRWLFCALRPTV